MTKIILEAECGVGFALCKRGHYCKSADPIETVYRDWIEDEGLVRRKKDFHICPHLLLKARLEG